MLFNHRFPRTLVRALALVLFGAISVAAGEAQASIDMQVKRFVQAPDPSPVMGVVTWDIDVGNNNNSPAPDATLSVPLNAANFDFVSVTTSAGSCSFVSATSTVQCDFGTLNGALQVPAGVPVNVQLKVRPKLVGVFMTSATVGTSGADANPGNDTENINTTVVESADMTISTFTVSPTLPATAPGGSNVTYTVVAKNLGPFSAVDTKLSFTIPADLTYVSASGTGWTCSPSGSTLNCSNPNTVANGASSATLTWVGKVSGGLVGGTITSIGRVSSTTLDSDESDASNSKQATFGIGVGTDLAVSKTVTPNPAIGGNAVSFNIQVDNLGPQAAATLVLTDAVPAGFTAVSASGGGWDCSATAGNLVNCKRPALAVGSAPAITVSATAPPNASIPVGGTTVTNTAQIASATFDPVASNDSGSVTFDLQRDGADLTISSLTRVPLDDAGDPLPVSVGNDITTELTVHNNGPRSASGTIRATYKLAPGETFSSGTGTTWSCSVPAVPGDVVVCDYGSTLAASGGGSTSSSLTIITQKATAVASLTNAVCTGNGGTDPATAPNVPPTETDIQPGNDCTSTAGVQITNEVADLSLNKEVSTTQLPAAPVFAPAAPWPTLATGDDTITYRLTVRNNGTADATRVRLVDPIPMYSPAYFGRPATTVTATPPAGDSCSGTSTVTCDLGTITAGNDKVVLITVKRPLKDGTWTNNANTYSLDVGDSNRANNRDSADVTIAPVTDIELTAKDVSPPDVKAGVEATYVISIRNNGPSSANNVVVTDTFTVNAASGPFTPISVTSADGGASCSAFDTSTPAAPFVTCSFGTVGPFEVRSMTVKIRPDWMTTPPAGRHLGNQAVVTTSSVQSDLTNDEKSADLLISGAEVDLLIDQTDLADAVGFDPDLAADPTKNLIVYKFDITNVGPSYATGVTFTNTWTGPAGHTLKFLCDLPTATATSNCTGAPVSLCSAVGSNPVSCTIGNLGVGAANMRSYYLIYQIVEEPLSTGTTYSNLSTVSSNEFETKSANNNSSETTTARILADVEVSSKIAKIGAAAATSVSLNQPFDWVVAIKNNGHGRAAKVVVKDVLPTGMVLQGTPAPSASVGSCTISGQTVECNLGEMLRDAVETITIPVKITIKPVPGPASNTASVVTDSIDIVSNNSKTGTVPVVVSSITGRVYHDKDNDGAFASPDAGISGVSVRLTGKDAYGNDIDITKSTNGSGVYLFDNLPPSDANGYLIEESQPGTFLDGKEVAAGTILPDVVIGADQYSKIVLLSNTALAGYDFGEVKGASIAGLIWHDKDNNGAKNGAEADISTVTQVTLTGVDDLNAITPQTINTAGGAYSFTGLRPGTYSVTEVTPAGYEPGFATQCTDATTAAGTPNNTLPGGADFGNKIVTITVVGGDTATGCNFGEVKRAALAGLVYFDTDGGQTKTGEPIIGGVTVTLTGTDYRGNTVTAVATTTDATTGAYSFPNLLPGTYTINETQPTGYSPGSEQVGTVDGAPSGTAAADKFTAIALVSEGVGINYDFGERAAGISGTVYNDISDDGIINAGESGLPLVDVRIQGCGVDITVKTNSAGQYHIAPLPACPTYVLTETQPANYSEGIVTAGDKGGTASTGVVPSTITAINLAATDYGKNYNFGEHGQNVTTDLSCSVAAVTAKTIREEFDVVFIINNTGDGAAPATKFNSPLPAGFELRGTPTTSKGTCVGAVGAATFTCDLGLVMKSPPSITVTAKIRALAYPANGNATSTATLTTEGQDDVADNNMCSPVLTITQATLAGKVFADPNDNGTQETDEEPIQDVVIKLTGKDIYQNDVLLETQTLADGTYKFTSLPPSDDTGYTVMEVQPAGRVDGKDTVGSIDGIAQGTLANDMVSGIVLATSKDAIGYDFAEIGQGLSGKVYVDSNNDGTPQPAELPIAGVTLTISGTDKDGKPVNLTQVTGADGMYFFAGLKPSNADGYTLTETQPSLWADGKDTAGSAGGTAGADIVTAINLPAGVISTDYNFGERGAQLCGFVYSDLDDDGIKDADEVGLPEVVMTLTGKDANGVEIIRSTKTNKLVDKAAAPGRYCLQNLPLSDVNGYTITETQPTTLTDGKVTAGDLGGTAGVNVIAGVTITQVGVKGDNYNFGEIDPNAASLSGFVFLDGNHDRLRNDNNGRGGWTVELIRGPIGGPNKVIATTVSNPDGSYSFKGLPPGGGYSVLFRSPDGGYVFGYLKNLELTAGTELTEQNLPLDPSGVVYDVETRKPVPGAVVELVGPAGFDPKLHLVGGPANLKQTTDATGEYKYLLLPGAPAGVYGFQVTVPEGYVQQVSTGIPACSATLQVDPLPAPALVQNLSFAPSLKAPIQDPASCATDSSGLAAGADGTQYYLRVYLDANSADLINNHIPIEKVPASDAVIVSKTTPKTDVVIGELVPYTITVRNNKNYAQADLGVVDQLPPGFKYKKGSATIDGKKREPESAGRQLTWTKLSLKDDQVLTVKLLMIVGAGAGEAEFVNQAWAISTLVNLPVSNIATATVRVTPDPTFDCTDVIGKVYDDQNRNGAQDKGEPGIAAVRLATVKGELITTDADGRYHIACADIPDGDRGSNYIIKVDVRTLPTGYRLTTENPGLVRLTRGKMAKLNFGASIHRVVRLDLADAAFEPGSTELVSQWAGSIDPVLDQLDDENSVLRLAYGTGPNEDDALARDRVRALAEIFRGRFRDVAKGWGSRRDLIIETETYHGPNFK
jgi:large repetitive protein